MTKKEKTKRCQEILYGSKEMFIINRDDVDFLLYIFENHPNWEDKKGSGIYCISTTRTPNGTFCFEIHRTDGTKTDISFTKCITNPSKVSQIKAACRFAIKHEVINFKKENVIYGVTPCAISGIILQKDNVHIDHYELTFNEMFNLWINQEEINEEYLFEQIEPTKDNTFDTRFKDKDIEIDFLAFHNKHCKLRAVTPTVNLSLLRCK